MDASNRSSMADSADSRVGTTTMDPSWTALPWTALLASAVLGYVVLCSLLRFRFEKAMRRRFPYPDRASLARMTNDDAQAILQYIIVQEFPFMYKLSLQFAIFKTYGFPTMSKLIVATQALTHQTSAAKRYEDTVILFSEFSLNPPTSSRCLQALARMSVLHDRYKAAGQISNEDFLYTLAVCVTEPPRFMRLYEWRPLNDMERCAIGLFWKGIGEAMGIQYAGCLARAPDGWRDGLDFLEDITAWSAQYERDAMRPGGSNQPPSRRLVSMLLYYVPIFAQPFAMEVLTVLMGDRLRDAFQYPEPGLVATAVASIALIARRFVLRYLMLPRFAPVQLIGEQDPDSGRIPHTDYMIEPWYNKPTWMARWGPMALVTRALGGQVPTANKDNTFLSEGYLFQDIGPKSRMGEGVAKAAEEVERLRKVRTPGCPFS